MVPILANTVIRFFFALGAPQTICKFSEPSKTSQILSLSALGCFFISVILQITKSESPVDLSTNDSTSNPMLVNFFDKKLELQLKSKCSFNHLIENFILFPV